jgi:hypothetical protein
MDIEYLKDLSVTLDYVFFMHNYHGFSILFTDGCHEIFLGHESIHTHALVGVCCG